MTPYSAHHFVTLPYLSFTVAKNGSFENSAISRMIGNDIIHSIGKSKTHQAIVNRISTIKCIERAPLTARLRGAVRATLSSRMVRIFHEIH